MDKGELRGLAQKRLGKLSRDDFDKASRLLSKNITDYIKSLNFVGPVIGGYSPLRGELEWFHSELDGIELAIPKVLGSDRMEFRKVTKADLEGGFCGLKLEALQSYGESVTPDLLLIPGLAFTQEGVRLGRGGGFYDRYLEAFKGIKVGVAHSVQLFESIPADAHDITVDAVITESSIYKR